MPAGKKTNYLNNKDILKEIHKSKMSYCYVEDEKYNLFDIIVDDISDINPAIILQDRKSVV